METREQLAGGIRGRLTRQIESQRQRVIQQEEQKQKEEYEQQVSEYEKQQAEYEGQLKAYETEKSKQEAIQRDLNLLKQYAEASGKSGVLRYDASVGSIMEGLRQQGIPIEQSKMYYESIASGQTTYQLAAKYTGIRAEQKAIIEQLPEGIKPIWGKTGKLAGIESTTLNKTFPSIEAYNKYAQEYNALQISPEITKPLGVISPRLSTFEAIKQTYKRNIQEGDRSDISQGIKRPQEYLWKGLGITKGIISGTAEVVGKQVGATIEKTGELAHKIGISEFKYAGGAEIKAGEILGKTAIEIAPYTVPILGESLMIGFGAESIAKGETTKEKVMGGLGILGGTGSLAVRMFTKPSIITTPKKLEVTSKTEFLKSVKIENIPRLKIVEGKGIKTGGIVKRGTRTTISPVSPTTTTRITGENWEQVEIVSGGEREGVIITKAKPNPKLLFRRREYVIKYKELPTKEIKYDVFIKSGKDLIKSSEKLEIQSAEEQLGVTEFLKKSNQRIQKTVTLPTKSKIRTIEKIKVMEADIIKIGKSKYDISNVEVLFGTKTKQATIVSPAEKNIILREKFFEPKPVIKGEEVSTLKAVVSKKLTPKFAKSQPPDIELIKGELATPTKQAIGTTEFKTPRFTQVIETEAAGITKFTLKRKTALDKYLESNIMLSKKGQIQLLQPRVTELEQQARLVDIGKLKVAEVSKPELIKFQDIGKITIGEEKSLIGLSMIKLLPKTKEQIKTKLMEKAALKEINMLKPQVKMGEVQLFKQVELVKTKQLQKPMQLLKEVSEQIKRQEQSRFQRPRITEPKTPKQKTPRITIPKFDINLETKKLSAKEQVASIYGAYVRKAGEEVSLGEFKSLGEARIGLTKELRGTLRASGFVTRAGKKLKASELGMFGNEFVPSKVDVFRIVQRKGKRLSARPEVREIQFFKRRKQSLI